MWVDPERDGWRIVECGIGITLPMPCCEDDDDELGPDKVLNTGSASIEYVYNSSESNPNLLFYSGEEDE